ncbi:MBL fold metallo-hydrolase [Sporosarcina luteola]|uniref:MBL fold metallo-hydrolase n=1 Tax=Sporosarcina luteola TaxID=582850 RepID=UPI00203ECB79|nr:MBL fold metallo-hydrolase [Sporosarcina luteola]MCM3636878.1 MBL fold metallo-hydrolase [Sporosarcina luteola]
MYEKIGPIEIFGDNSSKVPFCTTLLLTNNRESALLECGAGFDSLKYIEKNYFVRDIYLTHHHIDHVWGVPFFPQASVHINYFDFEKASDIYAISHADGMLAVQDEATLQFWLKQQENRHFGGVSVGKRTIQADCIYPMDKPIEIAGIDVHFIHAPGHSEGYTVPYIEKYGIAYVGDFDLTSFGPFYNELEAEIDDFITSAKKVGNLDAKYFVTGHHKGIVSKKEYNEKVIDFLNIIEKRHEKISWCIRNGVSPDQLIEQDIFYRKEQREGSILRLKNEVIGIYKHLQQLLRDDEVCTQFVETFIQNHIARPEYLKW